MINVFKLARLEKGITQLQLAKETGIYHSRLSEIECGWRIARPDELTRLEKALPKLKELMGKDE
jgi:transcriptional regulator with XRE-family HTH domain